MLYHDPVGDVENIINNFNFVRKYLGLTARDISNLMSENFPLYGDHYKDKPDLGRHKLHRLLSGNSTLKVCDAIMIACVLNIPFIMIGLNPSVFRSWYARREELEDENNLAFREAANKELGPFGLSDRGGWREPSVGGVEGGSSLRWALRQDSSTNDEGSGPESG